MVAYSTGSTHRNTKTFYIHISLFHFISRIFLDACVFGTDGGTHSVQLLPSSSLRNTIESIHVYIHIKNQFEAEAAANATKRDKDMAIYAVEQAAGEQAAETAAAAG